MVRGWSKALVFSKSSFGRPVSYEHSDPENQVGSRIKEVRRMPNSGMANVENDEVSTDSDNESYKDKKVEPEIHRFVQSLSNCTRVRRFGLSFGFESLKFQPNASAKPILSEVSGHINSGTLWGIMGASGAGKSTFVNVLMGQSSLENVFSKDGLVDSSILSGSVKHGIYIASMFRNLLLIL